MGMKKGQKQYGEAFTLKIMELKTQGMTLLQIADKLGVEHNVVKRAVTRQNKRNRKQEQGEILKRGSGRPRIKPMTTEQEYQKRIKELEMENELLKKFHEELRR